MSPRRNGNAQKTKRKRAEKKKRKKGALRDRREIRRQSS